ncbi:hypothetical protein BU26DRAFT_567738 [Trematosphaeria pertusa]|uniref:Uncharacterized protein n=1 Tax=Trematosphaeria pertusa TaxID=390896 RepID=A0A6A6I9Q0_9PLEO|nr:uncharacterized protein BU26DRAFT_567738 [Trematosphaeria pertusa]KAF2246250.1 hypothetical protein BU26DRAFT_567738 [Trematosphaeria pertusa]
MASDAWSTNTLMLLLRICAAVAPFAAGYLQYRAICNLHSKNQAQAQGQARTLSNNNAPPPPTPASNGPMRTPIDTPRVIEILCNAIGTLNGAVVDLSKRFDDERPIDGRPARPDMRGRFPRRRSPSPRYARARSEDSEEFIPRPFSHRAPRRWNGGDGFWWREYGSDAATQMLISKKVSGKD